MLTSLLAFYLQRMCWKLRRIQWNKVACSISTFDSSKEYRTLDVTALDASYILSYLELTFSDELPIVCMNSYRNATDCKTRQIAKSLEKAAKSEKTGRAENVTRRPNKTKIEIFFPG